MRGARKVLAISLAAAGLLSASLAQTPDAIPKLELNIRNAEPRSVEELTARTISRDYRLAWQSLADAFQYSSPGLLDAYFTGTARENTRNAIVGQRRNHFHAQYADQEHQLEVVFYAPEGDVMELHDTAQFQRQVSDGSKVIYDERGVHYYVVLMTPAADRWLIRQLQEVPHF